MEKQKRKIMFTRMKSCDIPEELLIEIFKRLPTKTLVQLLCISKSWHSLITSPVFISAHISHQQTDPTTCHLFSKLSNFCVLKDVNDNFHKLDEFTFKFPVNQNYILVGCCHGVVCMLNSSCGYVILWNPSIRKKVTLDMPCIGGKDLIFGFGFDSIRNEYKMVRVAYFKGSKSNTTHLSADIYLLNKGTWKIVDACMPFSISRIVTREGVHVNGVIHWVFMLSDGSYSILTLSLGDEKFGEMPVPKDITRGSNVALASVNSRREMLALTQPGQVCSLWVMKDQGVVDSWVKLLTVNFENPYQPGRILGVRMNGEIIVRTWDDRWLSFDLEGVLKKQLGVHNGCSCSLDHDGSYVESLVLLRQQHC